MFKLNRRQMLRSMVLGGSMAAFGGYSAMGDLQLAHALDDPDKAIPDRYYIFCYFSGAWDILLSLDPKDPAIFHNGNIATTRIQPGYDLLGFTSDPRLGASMGGGKTMLDTHTGEQAFFGPYMGDLITNPDLAERLLVVRGMSMDTLTHQVGRRRFLTGKQPAGLNARGSSTDTWLASRLSDKEIIPNLAMRMESYNKDQPSFASAMRASTSDDLLRILSPGDTQLDASQEAQLDALLRQNALCQNSQLSSTLTIAEESRVKTREMLSGGLDRLFDFKARTEEMARMRDAFSIQNNSSSSSSEVQTAVAATAITRGVSRCVSIEVARGLDTHFDNWVTDQGSRQQAGFDSISRLANYLLQTPYYKDGVLDGNWLDKTVIVGFSEFSRTPMINTSNGRDHWLGNASFLLGGGVKGGRTIGKSSDFGMYPSAVDLKTGLLDEGGEVIRPEHIIQALYNEVGIYEEPDLRVEGLEAIFG